MCVYKENNFVNINDPDLHISTAQKHMRAALFISSNSDMPIYFAEFQQYFTFSFLNIWYIFPQVCTGMIT